MKNNGGKKSLIHRLWVEWVVTSGKHIGKLSVSATLIAYKLKTIVNLFFVAAMFPISFRKACTQIKMSKRKAWNEPPARQKRFQKVVLNSTIYRCGLVDIGI